MRSVKMVPISAKLVLVFLLACSVSVLGDENVLSLKESTLPDLRPSAAADPRSSNNLLTSAARSVNLSFFIPAFSLFALASQLMPQMFPSFATATTSSRAFPRNTHSPLPRSRSSPTTTNSRGRFNRGRSSTTR